MSLPELETSDWYALLMPCYAAVLAIEIVVAHRRRLRWFDFSEALSNLSAGMGTLLMGLLIGPLVLGVYSFTYQHFAVVTWREGSWLKWPCALLICDFCYYAWHRSGHRFGLLWAIHGVHHQHERLNSTVGLRLEWLGDIVASCFFWPLPLFGIEPTTGFSAIAALSAYTLTAHMPLCSRPTLGIFVTPGVHGGHHSRDARYFGKNFGAMFSIWDRLFRTYRAPEKGEVLGEEVPTICRMHDAVSGQWILVGELLRNLRDATSWRARWVLLAQPPEIAQPLETPRTEQEVTARERGAILVRFLGVGALGSWVWWLRSSHSVPVLIGGALLAGWGLRLVGGRLDGRSSADREEWIWSGVAFTFAAVLTRAEPLGAVLIVTVVALFCVARVPVRSAGSHPVA